MTRNAYVVVTAPNGWAWSHGIDMLASRAFKDQPVGFLMEGWTVAARCATSAGAEAVRQETLRKGLDSMVLVFVDESEDDRRSH